MRRRALWLLAWLWLFLPGAAAAQQHLPANAIFLVAKPTLADPNFARTVVLVTQTEDGGTVGVIVNRPTRLRLSQFLSQEFPTQNYKHPIFFGGPVMRQALVSLFRSESVPKAAAFHVLKNVYLTMHSDNIESLLKDPKASYRMYAGFSGWAPRQLEGELERDGWHVLPARPEIVFRKDTATLWQELVNRVANRGGTRFEAPQTDGPAERGL